MSVICDALSLSISLSRFFRSVRLRFQPRFVCRRVLGRADGRLRAADVEHAHRGQGAQAQAARPGVYSVGLLVVGLFALLLSDVLCVRLITLETRSFFV